jgi:serine/threonine protein kinase
MGEVYRATDANLKRDVAIKVLPESVASDAERLARFQREAEVLARLNHPNIAAVYGLERSAGITGLVMELVEGTTLADRIAQRPVPVDEALPIAKQIAEALEAAHEQGIIHRDLKPANIKVRQDGTVKVLDFGLAKALEPRNAGSIEATASPTVTSPAVITGVGVLLGTAAYMAPEQARGNVVDKRADIWAFGCVIYEMLTGRRAFGGENVQDTVVAVMRDEPDWARLPATVPPVLGTYIRRCLYKDPKQRIADVQDLRLALEGAFEPLSPSTTVSGTFAGPRRRLAWVGVIVAALAVSAMAVPTVRHMLETPLSETRVEIVTPTTGDPTSFALSPDGRQIVFTATGDGTSHLWLRSLATTTAQPLPGTEGARMPFWAPDSRAIGFFAGASLKRLDLNGGAPLTLASIGGTGLGGTWSSSGVILFGTGTGVNAALMRVSATGGDVSAATTVGSQQMGHVAPFFLPDGRRFLFYVRGESAVAGIYLGALDSDTSTRLTPADSAGVYLPPGWLLWVRAGTQTLIAQRLDVEQADLTGEPVTVADAVAIGAGASAAVSAVSVSAGGLVSYRSAARSRQQLTWVDRSGAARGTVGDPDATLDFPRLSPDGRRVAVGRTVQGNEDVWLLDDVRMSRVTFDPAADARPLWSPDGRRIVFRSNRTGRGDLYLRLTNGASAEERLVASDEVNNPLSWSSDGRFLLYGRLDAQTGQDLWILPMGGDHTPLVFLKTPFREVYGAFSPDGRWVAYQSNESGRPEIYIRRFVPPEAPRTTSAESPGQWQVSTTGGITPVWRSDGNELYYINPAGGMVAVPIAVAGDTLAPGAPVVLFQTRIYGGGMDRQLGWQYDVGPDGRFLINTELDSAPPPITLLQNWDPEAAR